jgi:hypothetical protein
VAVAESSTPRLIGVHGKPGLRGLSPSHLVSRSYFLDDPKQEQDGRNGTDDLTAPLPACVRWFDARESSRTKGLDQQHEFLSYVFSDVLTLQAGSGSFCQGYDMR